MNATVTDPNYIGSANGTLVIAPSKQTIALQGLTQTYDGTAKSVTVTTNPAGLASTVSYTDTNGNPVTSPTAAGFYHVVATITDPHYTGSASGTFIIAPAQIIASGITASNKVYDGTTKATVNATNAACDWPDRGRPGDAERQQCHGHVRHRERGHG